MELPSGVFRQQQTWTPNKMESTGNDRLVAYNNCEHSYNNLAFNNPSTSELNYRNDFKYSDNNNVNRFILGVATSPTTKKNSQQKFSQWPPIKQRSNLVSIKSKLGVEFRRYAVQRQEINRFEDFFKKVDALHQLQGATFNLYYSDQDGELLPINNDDNLAKAIDTTTRLKSNHYIVANNNNLQMNFMPHPYQPQQHQFQPTLQHVIQERPFLKVFIEKKGIPNEIYHLPNYTLKCKRKDNLINMLIPSSANSSLESRPRIGRPEDFRQVSSIIDADILPKTRRRVVLKRGGSDKPLGFYIRDGTVQRMNSHGTVEKSYGIFISRVVPGGLAESTNLLAENDEILEVNGIEVGKNKSLDQVRDMMVANSSNLIITTRPVNPSNQYSISYYNRIRCRNMNNFNARNRLPSTQSASSDLGEDYVRHYMK